MSECEDKTRTGICSVCDDKVNQIATLKSRLDAFEAIVSESDGVAGYHLNGEVATWDELLDQAQEEVK